MKKLIVSIFIVVAAASATLAGDTAAVTAAATTKAGSTNEPTVVTSDHLEADYSHNVGTFTGNVLAIDPRITVRSDKMTVFFASTNLVIATTTNATRSVQKIVAEGAVVITTPENRRANSERAEYTAADGKVVLTGHPQVLSSDGIVTGKRITFWRGDEKMDVESDVTDTNRTKLIIYPEEQRKKE